MSTTKVNGLGRGNRDASRSTKVDVNNPNPMECQKIISDLYKEHFSPLCAFLRNRLEHDEEQAKEVAQETFIALTRHVKNGGSVTHGRGLIFQIAKTKLIDHHRRNTARMADMHADIDDFALENPGPSCEDIANSEERLLQLEEAILGLPTKCQEVFVLRAFENLKNSEIAERCGISVSMVEKHLNKGFKIVREKMWR